MGKHQPLTPHHCRISIEISQPSPYNVSVGCEKYITQLIVLISVTAIVIPR